MALFFGASRTPSTDVLSQSLSRDLPGATMHVVEFDDSLDDQLVNLADSVLTEAEKSVFASFSRVSRQREWLCARIAGKNAARQWLDQHGFMGQFPDIEIGALASGAPSLARLPASISLAHTTHIAVAVVSDQPVGVDVELADRSVHRLGRALSPSERDDCEKFGRRPLEVFMAKEAAGKALGIGLAGSPGAFSAIFDGQDWWVSGPDLREPALPVRIFAHGVHVIAICRGSSSVIEQA